MGSFFDLRPVFYVIGALLVMLSLTMAIPMLVDIVYGNDQDFLAFFMAMALTMFFGVLLILMNRSNAADLSLRQIFFMTSVAYIFLGSFSFLPFWLSDIGLSMTDAYFEAISGFTTTGSTIMTDLDNAPEGILVWRAILQWLGGIGIIAIGMLVLPFLRVGGMQVFRAESSDNYEKVVPRLAVMVQQIGIIYLVFTVITQAALMLAGMPVFDAICNGFTAVATGGFATRDASIGAFENPAVEWIVICAMIAGSLPFVRYISLLRGQVQSFWKDSQIRRFLFLSKQRWKKIVYKGCILETHNKVIQSVESLRTCTVAILSAPSSSS